MPEFTIITRETLTRHYKVKARSFEAAAQKVEANIETGAHNAALADVDVFEGDEEVVW